MNELADWFERQARREQRAVYLEEALLGNRFWAYAFYRLRYFFARYAVASADARGNRPPAVPVLRPHALRHRARRVRRRERGQQLLVGLAGGDARRGRRLYRLRSPHLIPKAIGRWLSLSLQLTLLTASRTCSGSPCSCSRERDARAGRRCTSSRSAPALDPVLHARLPLGDLRHPADLPAAAGDPRRRVRRRHGTRRAHAPARRLGAAGGSARRQCRSSPGCPSTSRAARTGSSVSRRRRSSRSRVNCLAAPRCAPRLPGRRLLLRAHGHRLAARPRPLHDRARTRSENGAVRALLPPRRRPSAPAPSGRSSSTSISSASRSACSGTSGGASSATCCGSRSSSASSSRASRR